MNHRINQTLREPRSELRLRLTATLRAALQDRRQALAGSLGGAPSDSLLVEYLLREHFGLPMPRRPQ